MRAGSTTAAAELLRLSQPTISKLIAQLEHEIKLKLFDRTAGRLVPRQEARLLLRNVDNVFHAVDDVALYAEQLARSQSGHIRIVATASLGAYVLPMAVAEFMAAHPDVRVTLRTASTSYVKEWIASQQADIGFVTESPPVSGMAIKRFQDGSTAVCLLPLGHTLARKKTIKPSDLLKTPFISVDRDTPFNRTVKQILFKAGVNDRMVVETNRSMTASALVAQGVGVAIVNPFAALSCHSQGNVLLRPFATPVKSSVDILMAAERKMPLLVDEFLNYVTKQKGDMEIRLRKAFIEGLPKAQ